VNNNTKRIIIWSIAALVLIGAGAALFIHLRPAPPSVSYQQVKYRCPMHPTYVSDHPGDCPICGMRLVPFEAGAKYTCPMHPEVVSDKPGVCPICNMALVPQKTSGAAQPGQTAPAKSGPTSERRILYYRNPMNPEVTSPVPAKDDMGMDYLPVYSGEDVAPSNVKGLATVTVDEEGRRQAGIQTVAAKLGQLSRRVRTVGTVTPDETRIRHVHTKVGGWIEKLYVNFTGQAVRKGQPILALYSQELLASQQEYLQALEASRALKSGNTYLSASQMVRAARSRLELFDVPSSFISDLEKSGSPRRDVTLLSPVSGFVTAKSIYEGQQVEPGMELYTVSDLSRVWVQAALYENETPLVHVGQKAAFTLPYDPRSHLFAAVRYIDPSINAESRTLKVRFDFDNRDLSLKPGMFVDVAIDVEPQNGIVVPDSAVIDTGVRKVLYVDLGDGRFAPREVQVGLRTEGQAVILSGLAAGEKVAVKGNFLLDSESRIRGTAVAALEEK
jgi:RND family efflux transporter MFP subunit